MLLIDKYAYINRLKDVHPMEKMVFTALLLLFSLTVRDQLISLITFIVMSAFIIFGAKIPWRYYVKLLLLPSFFLLTSLLAILVSFAGPTSALPPHIFALSFTRFQLFIGVASVAVAKQLFFVVLASISALYFLILTTSVQAICYVLYKWRIPPLFVELCEMTYRFIFIFLENTQKIYIAQQSRLGYQSPRQWLRSVGLLVSALFIEVLQRSTELTSAMLSRGYDPSNTTPLYFEEQWQFRKRNWLGIAVIFGAIVAVYVGGRQW
ncbi:cobalt ECF transporter T component CbiQ [Metalysinibacillus jejuensis]|uniref:cobalt ECF transporter T component CbiQ n=1 Tax=Metalysinibacillus jejuensis TaxID=914327 RepID=UPI000D3B8290|nr:cobalt ECF transporter T component CbiQ [Metalysinibacillus jejuensis]